MGEMKMKNMSKKGNAGSHAINYLVVGLLVIVMLSVLSGTIFSYLGTGAVGLGNTTANPSVPTWLPSLLIIIVAIGLVFLVLRAFGMHKN